MVCAGPVSAEVGVPEGSCDPTESRRGNRFLTGPVTPWEDHTETDFEELQLVGEIHVEEGCKELFPVGGL